MMFYIIIIIFIVLYFSLRKKESFENTYKSAGYFICENKVDKWENVHVGSINFLANHDVKCKDGHVINKLQLETNGKQSRYKYNCCKIVSTNEKPVILDVKDKETPYDISGGWDATYLDKHPLNCDKGLLSSMKLVPGHGPQNPSEKLDTIHYDYSCVTPNVDKLKMEYVCIDKETEPTNESKNFALLGKHKIKCDEHQAINKLQLVRNNGKWRYKYKCCSLGML